MLIEILLGFDFETHLLPDIIFHTVGKYVFINNSIK